jgi:hypothetical protein
MDRCAGPNDVHLFLAVVNMFIVVIIIIFFFFVIIIIVTTTIFIFFKLKEHIAEVQIACVLNFLGLGLILKYHIVAMYVLLIDKLYFI